MSWRTAVLNFLLKLAHAIRGLPLVHGFLNKIITCAASSAAPPRPHQFSLWSPTDANGNHPTGAAAYVSWSGTFDRTFTARHLGPADNVWVATLPPVDAVWAVAERRGPMKPAAGSHALLCFFAQWFTDSFLRSDPADPRKNTSNHEIDLCQVYGLDEASTRALRLNDGGLLRTQQVDGVELPPRLFIGNEIDPHYYADPSHCSLSFLRTPELRTAWQERINSNVPGVQVIDDDERRKYLYALGLDRGGSTILYSAITIIFIREHNRIARLLAKTYDWDDDQLFETARLINIRQLLTVVINDYINHLTGGDPGLVLDRSFAEKQHWYRTNRISIEFNLLYRWHAMIPDRFEGPDGPIAAQDFRFNNHLLEQLGIVRTITAASRAPMGDLRLHNVPGFMAMAENNGLGWARLMRLRPFNDYRERFGFSRYRSFDALTGDTQTARALSAIYRSVDDVEFTVGLMAETRRAGDLLPETLRAMVAYDAFTHILTNPLLATELHREDTFSAVGLAIIEERASLADIIDRNSQVEQQRGEQLLIQL